MRYADPEAQAEIDRLTTKVRLLEDGALAAAEAYRAEIDRLRKVLLAEWEKDRKTYAALMEKLK